MLFWKQNRQPKSSLTSSTGVGNPKELLEGPHERDHFFDQFDSEVTSFDVFRRKRGRDSRVKFISRTRSSRNTKPRRRRDKVNVFSDHPWRFFCSSIILYGTSRFLSWRTNVMRPRALIIECLELERNSASRGRHTSQSMSLPPRAAAEC